VVRVRARPGQLWFLSAIVISIACSPTASVTPAAMESGLSISPVLIGAAPPFSKVVAGFVHTCALTDDGAAYCWGSNDYSQLGADDTSRVPVPVSGGLQFKTISAGWVHNCGITTDDLTFCWGGGSIAKQGYLGNAELSRTTSPVRVLADSSFVSLTIGDGHTCALTASGMAYCWGMNTFGQLGDGSMQDQAVPAAVATTLRFRSLSAGAYHTCGITDADEAYCWGDNRWGELGAGDVAYNAIDAASPIPQRVLGDHAFQSIAAGWEHTCAIATTSRAYCWGRNDNARQLGDDSDVTHRGTPAAVAGNLSFTALSSGALSTCGITSSAETFCWGSNYYGGLGNGETSRGVGHPVRAQGGPFVAVAVGQSHACGVGQDRRLWCWGDTSAGQF
jgi:alpha-tubulin suppressor-like RCC1 family protein